MNIYQVGNFKIREDVVKAIKDASDATGMTFGYMMAMAAKESSFNPAAAAPTSSAKGLYQFVKGTWQYMLNKYPDQINDDILNPIDAAMAGALYSKENQEHLVNVLGRDISDGELYLGHFLGPGTAGKLLKGSDDDDTTDLVGEAPINANKWVFMNKDGSLKTVSEVKAWADNSINPLSDMFADFLTKVNI